MASLADIQRRLEHVRTRERNVIMMTGLARAFLTLLASVLVYFVFDLLFKLPFWARWITVLGLLSYLGYTVYKYLILELRKILDDDEIALRIEARNPDLRGRLISTLQLRRAEKSGGFAGSQELLEALEEDTLSAAGPLDFLKVINKEAMVRFMVAAGVVLAIKLACLIKFPEYFEALAHRLVDSESEFPTNVRISEISAPASVPRGEEVIVTVKLDERYEIPTSPMEVVFHSKNGDTTVPLDGEGHNVYKAKLDKALEDFTPEAHCGDAVKALKDKVRVVPIPEVKSGTMQYVLPEYARGAFETDPKPEDFGPINVLMGSTVAVEFEATKPLVSASLDFSDNTSAPMEKADNSGIHWRLKEPYKVTKNVTYHVNLYDEDKLHNSQPPVEYSVRPKDDGVPFVRLKRPAKDATAPPKLRPKVIFDAKDDYGLKKITLAYRIQKELKGEGGAAQIQQGQIVRIPLEIPELKGFNPKPLADYPLNWNLEPLNLQVGDQLVFWIEADDYCEYNREALQRKPHNGDAPEPPAEQRKALGSSNEVKLTIISAADKMLEIQAEIARQMEQVGEAKKSEEDVKKETRDLFEQLKNMQK